MDSEENFPANIQVRLMLRRYSSYAEAQRTAKKNEDQHKKEAILVQKSSVCLMLDRLTIFGPNAVADPLVKLDRPQIKR